MRIHVRVVIVVTVACLAVSHAARAGDRLADATALYDDAMYSQALERFDQLASENATPRIHQYRALCLIALGRTDAAERAMAEAVATDPFFTPDADAASPRVVSMFAAVRRRLLPPMIRRGFAEATALFREGARLRATERFDDVLRLLDDSALRDDQSLADLALVASAFVELTRAQAAPARPAPPAVPEAALAAAGAEPSAP